MKLEFLLPRSKTKPAQNLVINSALVGTTEIDKKYHFIIENVVYKLYGRKGSEGVKTENVDGYSVTYEDWDDMFKPYRKILDKDFGLDGSLARKGKVKFLFLL